MDRPLHADDFIALKTDPAKRGLVERTHDDVETHEPNPGHTEVHRIVHDNDLTKSAFRKFLRDGVPPKGFALVRWDDQAAAHLIADHKVDLLDRLFLIGDVVRKTASDAMSGVIINTFTSCTLQPLGDVTYRGKHKLKGSTRLPLLANFSQSDEDRPAVLTNIPSHELKYAEHLTEEELVVYKDWIGRVVLVDNNITLKLVDNCVVEIKSDLAEYADGSEGPFNTGDIVVTVKGNLRHGGWIFGQYNPNTPPVGTVVRIRNVHAEIVWIQRRIGSTNENEPPAVLERDELESVDFHVYDRTRLATGQASSAETVSNSETGVQIALKVRFRDLEAACAKYAGSRADGKFPRFDRKDTLGYDLNVFEVVSYTTDVTVQWQDLSITREKSVHLVPDMSLDDEHAAWPGEIAHTVDVGPVPNLPGAMQPSKVGVLQSVKAAERMARVQWAPEACLQYTEDDQGTRTLIHGAVGRALGPVEELSLYDLETPAALNVRRGDIVLVKNAEASTSPEPGERRWLGEVVDTCLDGTLLVRLGAAATVEDVRLMREECFIAVRSDGTGEFDGADADDLMEDVIDSSLDEDMIGDTDEDSEAVEDDDEEPQASYEDEDGQPLDEDDVENEEWESDDGADTDMPDASQMTPPTPLTATPPDVPTAAAEAVDADQSSGDGWEELEAYMILASPVSESHHFAHKPSSDSPLHIKRTQREHRIIRSSLPKGVFVRSWESRLDLLRVLFVGPQDTPYQDAPFVVDIYLPHQFPTEPPQAFFHSWSTVSNPGGVGKVNPNLYEDGKICISLLGTWEGEKGEGWNASRSTLLQVIVSILGLVLVKQPYFNEAGYEHLVGLEAYQRPSALYNEQAYLRARTFVLVVLDSLEEDATPLAGLEGLEEEVKMLYTHCRGPQLRHKVVMDLEDVLRRSEREDAEPDGVLVMSKGACIPLRRILAKLKSLRP